MVYCLCAILTLLAAVKASTASSKVSEALRLVEKVTKTYPGDGLVVPMLGNGSEPVPVTVRLVINSFEGIDDDREVMTILGYVSMRWSDEFVTSMGPARIPNSSDRFLTQFIPATSIWVPSIYQTKDPKDPRSLVEARKSTSAEVRFPINRSGEAIVRWDVDGRFQGRCKMNVRMFPFDEQTCHFAFLAMEGADKVRLSVPPENAPWEVFFDNDQSQTSDMWHIENVEWTNETFKGNITGVTFQIRASRHPHYYTATIILPCILIAILQLVGLFHPHSAERPNYFVAVLVAYWVLLEIISNVIPYDPKQNCAIVLCISTLSCLNVIYIIQSSAVLRFSKMFPVKDPKPVLPTVNYSSALANEERNAELRKAKRAKILFYLDFSFFIFGVCCTLTAPYYFYNG